MTIFEMLGQSGVLALLGMGIVFSFLVLLVASISFVGKFFSKDLGNNTDANSIKAGLATAAGADNNARITAAISSAITEYRKANK
jgi:oxaloacetate decarboxylase gamma subunit